MRTLLLSLLLLLVAGPLVAGERLEGRWSLVLVREGWTPQEARGTLVLHRKGKTWSGHLTFDVLMNGQRQALSELRVRGRKLSFEVAALSYSFEGELASEAISGVCRAKQGQRWTWTATRAKEPPPVELFEKGLSAAGFRPRAEPDDVGLDVDALRSLVHEAEVADTDALIVCKDGKAICERTFGRPGGPIPLMSVTKFVTGLAIGLLLEDSRIETLDERVSTWFPEWNRGEHAKVTLRHLVTHTSGIAHGTTARDLNAATDRVRYVLGLEVDDPGMEWSYSNEATALLSGIVGKAAERPCDAYLAARLFEPLGIESAAWDRDEAGQTITYAQLSLSARDLARIGVLVADRGRWGSKALVSEATIDLLAGQATPVAPTQGVLWFRILEGTTAVGVRHDGWLGQHLVVYPKERLVGIRLRRGRQGDDPRYGFGSFAARLRECVVP